MVFLIRDDTRDYRVLMVIEVLQLVNRYRRFEKSCCLLLQDQSKKRVERYAVTVGHYLQTYEMIRQSKAHLQLCDLKALPFLQTSVSVYQSKRHSIRLQSA